MADRGLFSPSVVSVVRRYRQLSSLVNRQNIKLYGYESAIRLSVLCVYLLSLIKEAVSSILSITRHLLICRRRQHWASNNLLRGVMRLAFKPASVEIFLNSSWIMSLWMHRVIKYRRCVGYGRQGASPWKPVEALEGLVFRAGLIA